jgi:hypothetical protein
VGIRIIACRVGQAPQVEELPNSQESMQQFVGGSMERVAVGDKVWLICRADGDGGGAPNRYLPLTGGPCLISGDFFLAAHTGDELTSLTDDQVDTWSSRAAGWQAAA